MRIQPTVLLLGAAAFVAILVATSRNGIGAAPDSISYISVARSIANGSGFTTFSGAAFVDQPPLYPLILAGIQWLLGIDPLQTARTFSALVSGLITALSTWIGFRWFRSVFVSLLAGILVLFSIPLFSVSIIARPEPLFILLTLSFLFGMKQYLDESHPRRLLVCSMLAGLAVLTRYIGVTLIVSGALLIVFFGGSTPGIRIRRALVLGITSSFFPIIWLIRNWLAADTLLGERAPSSASLADNLHYTARTLFGWFFPAGLYHAGIVIAGIVIVVAACVILRSRIRDESIARVLVTFSGVYTVFLIASSTTTAYDHINDRLLSPVFIPLIFLMLLVLDAALRRLPPAPQWGKAAIVLLVGLFWSYPIFYTGSEVFLKAAHGAGGFSTDEWTSSETIHYLEQTRLIEGCEVYSNLPEPLYLYFEVKARLTPRKYYYNSPKRADSLRDLAGKWPQADSSCLIWFTSGRPYLYPVEDLTAIVDVSVIAALDDGTIYRFSRNE